MEESFNIQHSTKSDDPFLKLTFADLTDWAGETILERGKEYQFEERVINLCHTASNCLLADVRGNHLYMTAVYLEDGQLVSECSCPYGFACKHAVAVILEYIARIKTGQTIPQASSHDRRLKLINKSGDSEGESELTKTSGDAVNLPDNLKTVLAKKNKPELIRILTEIITENPQYRELLSIEIENPESKSVERLFRSLGKEIDNICSEPVWGDYRYDDEDMPDYSIIQKGFQKLLDSGRPDEVVELGTVFFERNNNQIVQSNDDGITAIEIEDCMNLFFKALYKCSLPEIEKLERAVNIELTDEYEICAGLDSFYEQAFSSSAWGELADRLLERLNQGEFQPSGDFHSSFRRSQVVDIILRALHNAGRDSEALPFCMAEAENTHDYPRVVRLLIESGRIDEAEAWIKKGYEATKTKYSGIAKDLIELAVQIKSAQKEWSAIAAIRAAEFFQSPALNTYNMLMSAAKKTGFLPEVRQAIQRFLEKGRLPKESGNSWPLQESCLPLVSYRNSYKFPISNLLLEIAINEKHVEETLRWLEYDRRQLQDLYYYPNNLYDQAAEFLSKKYPDAAVVTWRNIAEFYIGQKNVSAYRTAVRYLLKIEQVLDKSGRISEWRALLDAIQTEHKRKYRLMELLECRGNKPIFNVE